MDDHETISIDGATVRRLRRGLFLGQRELAKKAGVTRETIAKLEMGQRPRSRPSTIRAIADALGVDPRELLRESVG